MKFYRKVKKSFALLTAVIFLQTTLLTPDVLANIEMTQATFLSNHLQLQIPNDFGKLILKNTSPENNHTIIHIEDAHANFDAQKNIEKILKFLKKEKNINMAFVEGAHDELNTSRLDLSNYSKEEMNEIIETLLEKGQLTGAEAYLLKNNQHKIYGVENIEKYLSNRDAFKEVYQNKSIALSFLKEALLQIQKEISLKANKEIGSFLKKYIQYKSEIMSLSSWTNFLGEISVKNLNSVNHQFEWPILTRYFRLKEIEEGIHFTKVEEELRLFWKTVNEKAKSHRNEVEAVFKKAKEGKLQTYQTRFVFERLMDELPEGYQFENYPELKKQIQFMILSSELVTDEFVKEVENLENEVLDYLIKTKEEAELVERLKAYFLLNKLFHLKLSKEEYLEIKEKQISPKKMISASQRESFKPQELKKVFQSAIYFYDLAIQRDEAFVQNAIKMMALKKEKAAALITGGFHSEGLEQAFAKENVNYIRVQPHISKVREEEHQNYIKALLGSKQSLGSKVQASANNYLGAAAILSSLADYIPHRRSEAKSIISEITLTQSLATTTRSENRWENVNYINHRLLDILIELDHPGVTKFRKNGNDYEVLLSEDTYMGDWLVKQYKENDLKEFSRLVLEVTILIGETLVAVHGAGAYHNDLNPSNIFVSSETNDPMLKDWGDGTFKDEDEFIGKFLDYILFLPAVIDYSEAPERKDEFIDAKVFIPLKEELFGNLDQGLVDLANMRQTGDISIADYLALLKEYHQKVYADYPLPTFNSTTRSEARIGIIGEHGEAQTVNSILTQLGHAPVTYTDDPGEETLQDLIERNQVIYFSPSPNVFGEYDDYRKRLEKIAAKFGVVLESARAKGHVERKVLVIRTMAELGITKHIYEKILDSSGLAEEVANFDVVFQPDFSFVEEVGEFKEDVVFGLRESESEAHKTATKVILEDLYAQDKTINVDYLDAASAELSKDIQLIYLASKLVHFNDLAELSKRYGADLSVATYGAGLDKRLKTLFSNPSYGFGGKLLLYMHWMRAKYLSLAQREFGESEEHIIQKLSSARTRLIDDNKTIEEIVAELPETLHVLFLIDNVLQINSENIKDFYNGIKPREGKLKGKKAFIMGVGYSHKNNQIVHSPALGLIEKLVRDGVKRITIVDANAREAFRIWLQAKRDAESHKPKDERKFNKVHFAGIDSMEDFSMGSDTFYQGIEESDLVIVATDSFMRRGNSDESDSDLLDLQKALHLERLTKSLDGKIFYDGLNLAGLRANGKNIFYSLEEIRESGMKYVSVGRVAVNAAEKEDELKGYELYDSYVLRDPEELKKHIVALNGSSGFNQKRVAVIGGGYVGNVTGALVSDLGHQVHMVDIIPEKIAGLNKPDMEVPIYEPGLRDMLIKNKKAGRVKFSTNGDEAIAESDIVYLAVGTPSQDTGEVDLRYILDAASQIGNVILEQNKDGENHRKIIVVKSTVTPNTFEEINRTLENQGLVLGKDYALVSNPEFLREGQAVKDVTEPDRTVLGFYAGMKHEDRVSAEREMLQLWQPLMERYPHEILVTDSASGTIVKYLANSFLAVSITLSNFFAVITKKSKADFTKIRQRLFNDARIGQHAFLWPGCGYGGSCFPKDVLALDWISTDVTDHDLIMIRIADRFNKYFKTAFLNGIDVEDKDVALLGMAFKNDTDDMRETSSVSVLRKLLKEGAKHIHIHDPIFRIKDAPPRETIIDHYLDYLYKVFSTDKDFRRAYTAYRGDGLQADLKNEINYFKDIYFVENFAERITFHDVFEGLPHVDTAIIVTDWKQYKDVDLLSLRTPKSSFEIYDGRNMQVHRKEEFAGKGIYYHGVGVKFIEPKENRSELRSDVEWANDILNLFEKERERKIFPEEVQNMGVVIQILSGFLRYDLVEYEVKWRIKDAIFQWEQQERNQKHRQREWSEANVDSMIKELFKRRSSLISQEEIENLVQNLRDGKTSALRQAVLILMDGHSSENHSMAISGLLKFPDKNMLKNILRATVQELSISRNLGNYVRFGKLLQRSNFSLYKSFEDKVKRAVYLKLFPKWRRDLKKRIDLGDPRAIKIKEKLLSISEAIQDRFQEPKNNSDRMRFNREGIISTDSKVAQIFSWVLDLEVLDRNQFVEKSGISKEEVSRVLSGDYRKSKPFRKGAYELFVDALIEGEESEILRDIQMAFEVEWIYYVVLNAFNLITSESKGDLIAVVEDLSVLPLHEGGLVFNEGGKSRDFFIHKINGSSENTFVRGYRFFENQIKSMLYSSEDVNMAIRLLLAEPNWRDPITVSLGQSLFTKERTSVRVGKIIYSNQGKTQKAATSISNGNIEIPLSEQIRSNYRRRNTYRDKATILEAIKERRSKRLAVTRQALRETKERGGNIALLRAIDRYNKKHSKEDQISLDAESLFEEDVTTSWFSQTDGKYHELSNEEREVLWGKKDKDEGVSWKLLIESFIPLINETLRKKLYSLKGDFSADAIGEANLIVSEAIDNWNLDSQLSITNYVKKSLEEELIKKTKKGRRKTGTYFFDEIYDDSNGHAMGEFYLGAEAAAVGNITDPGFHVDILGRLEGNEDRLSSRNIAEARSLILGTRSELRITDIISRNIALGGGNRQGIFGVQEITQGFVSLALLPVIIRSELRSNFFDSAAYADDATQNYDASKAVLGIAANELNNVYILGNEATTEQGLLALSLNVFEGNQFIVIANDLSHRNELYSYIVKNELEERVTLVDRDEEVLNVLDQREFRSLNPVAFLGMGDIQTADILSSRVKDIIYTTDERMQRFFDMAGAHIRKLTQNLAALLQVARAA